VLQVSVPSPHFTAYHFIKETVNPTLTVSSIKIGILAVTALDHTFVVMEVAEKSKVIAHLSLDVRTWTSLTCVKMVCAVPLRKSVTYAYNLSENA
jgi:hypothetical protein